MRELMRGGSRLRRSAGYLTVFAAVMGVYAVSILLLPEHGLAISMAFSTALIVYFLRRWRPIVPSYGREFANLEALVSLSPLRLHPVLPYSRMALDGIELDAVVSHAMLTDARVIVECGSGVSTLMLGNLLKTRQAGHLYALEEDELWHRHMAELVSAQGLGQYVDVVHAPIAEGWYSTSVAETVLARAPHVDLLLVDGPQTKAGQSRHDALRFFRGALDATSTVMLHDVNRAEEREVLTRWIGADAVKVDRILGEEAGGRGLAILNVTTGGPAA
ncbi:MAG: class I SAM-dependent methyltransferase [Chloroflexi bacterium]|nr:class I SAM-dependent methyltransferase [Chloroflexota bacterium]